MNCLFFNEKLSVKTDNLKDGQEPYFSVWKRVYIIFISADKNKRKEVAISKKNSIIPAEINFKF